ncbi:MAG TPA: YwbE family protein [Candidatus Methylomirabilis sp.]|nr:YwbE family protein [Candidatus Methylomirabilis sp.]
MDEPQTEGTIRRNISPGLVVVIVQKHHQRTGEMTQGIVQEILTSAPVHPRGIKVRLESGEVGRVQHIMS